MDELESQAMDASYVTSFVEYVYGSLCSADIVGNYVEVLIEQVDCMGDFGATKAELARYRKMIDRAAVLVDRIEAEAVEAAALVPLLLRAAVFEGGLDVMSGQWKAAARYAQRITVLWERLVRLATPCARRSVALVLGLPSAEEQRVVYDRASILLLASRAGIVRSDVLTVTSLEATVTALAGATFHVIAQQPAVLTVHPVDRPQSIVKFIAIGEGRWAIESEGTSRSAMEMGLSQIPEMVLKTLHDVCGVSAGDRLLVTTDGLARQPRARG
ncbi:MAG: hypothetical protein F2789_02155 [Actinobacteria bacterium]|nr:hypothetical protein [Actinomycetota bacterium]